MEGAIQSFKYNITLDSPGENTKINEANTKSLLIILYQKKNTVLKNMGLAKDTLKNFQH